MITQSKINFIQLYVEDLEKSINT